MPKTASVTVTADAGPGLQATAQVFTNIQSLTWNFPGNTFTIFDNGGVPFIFDYNDIATVTFTISGQNATITISS